jgi:hypothetical protein
MFRHPNYYKELRKRNKTDQVISPRAETSGTGVHPDPGLKRQASSAKLTDPQATSDKHQAPRHKRQA